MNLKFVNQAIPKLDGAALTGGKGVYTEDMVPRDCLVVQVLRSPPRPRPHQIHPQGRPPAGCPAFPAS